MSPFYRLLLISASFVAASRPDAAGAERGPRLVADLIPGTAGSNPVELTRVGNVLYFAAGTPTGYGLWKSDGTTAGTVLVKDGIGPEYMTAVGNTLYFVSGWLESRALWRSDGTAAGTIKVKNPSGTYMDSSFTVVGDTLYFSASKSMNWSELWKYTSEAAGIVLVKEFRAGSPGGNPSFLGAVGNTLYFTAVDDSFTQGMWTSGGTAATTQRFADYQFIVAVHPFGGALYFARADDTTLWRSNGTAAGTAPLLDLPSSAINPIGNFTNAGPAFYFTIGGSAGAELWRSDGTAAGTTRVGPASSQGQEFHVKNVGFAGGKLYLSAFLTGEPGTSKGFELWKTDGTTAGTTFVKELHPGPYESDPAGFTEAGGRVYFTANDRDLWRTDGTAQGTELVAELSPDITGELYSPLVAAGNKLFFVANTARFGKELYVYDTALDDGDMDTLPDTWERAMLGGLTFGAADDPDRDGQSNISEWLAGTHPMKGSDHLRLIPAGSDGSQIRFRISPVRTDLIYRLEYTSQTDIYWHSEALATYATAGEGEIFAPIPPSWPRFYRVRAFHQANP